MGKSVEITFAIGAALSGGFTGAFGKAGQALGELQKQAADLQKVSGQVESYQKMQGAIASNESAVASMRQQAQSLDAQITASKANTGELSTQYRAAQQEVERLNAAHVRNNDAYKAAQLNVQSLSNQIKASTGPTDELQLKYAKAQEESRRLGAAVKQSGAELQQAQAKAKGLKSEMQASSSQTKSLTREAKNLKSEADRLQGSIDHDREVLSKLQTELKGAGIDTNNLASAQARLTQQSQKAANAQKRLQDAQAKYEAARQRLSWNNIKGDVMTSAGLAYTLYKPISQAADFESAMARVNAVAFSGGGRNKEEDAKYFKELEKQARQLGRDTQFTAMQAANSQENLARAGFSANEIISAMPGLLAMAAAEGMDLANAADIAASTLRGFKLSADQSGRVADVLAQASAASNTSIAALGESMKYVAPVAANVGASIEEVSAALGIMANNGIKGSEGGTALRNAYLRLSQEPKAVAEALQKLGIASRTAQGDMRQLPDIMLELSKKMKDMGEADKVKYLANIFGVRAVSGMMAYMDGVLNGSFDKLYRLEKESTGVLQAVTNAVNAGTKEAIVSLDEMRAGMKNSEHLAESLGISFRDMSIYLAMFAEKGIKGEKADKALTALFTRLKKQPEQVKKSLKSLKIDPKNIKELPDLLNAIDTAISGMDDAKQLKILENIFGKADKSALKDIQTLIKSMGNGAFIKYDKAANNAKGVSHEMMEKLMGTFNGQLTAAKSATENFMIEIGKILLPYATTIVKGLGEIMKAVTAIMQEYPKISNAIVTALGAIAALKIIDKVQKIGSALIQLPGLWLNVAGATSGAKIAADAAGTTAVSAGGMFKNLWGIVAAHPFAAIITVSLLILTYWEDICAWIEKAVNWCQKAGAALSDPAFVKATTPVSMGGTKQAVGSAEYHIQAMNSMYAPPSIAYAKGGIITHPEISLIGEAGREAVIPLEDKSRGIPLLMTAARELSVNIPELMKVNNIVPHAEGGIFSQPHIGLVAEAGREAIIPLEDKSRGIPLWVAAGEEMGMPFSTSSTDNNIAPVFAPNIYITVNGEEPDTGQRFRHIAEELFEDLFIEFQERMQRLVFE